VSSQIGDLSVPKPSEANWDQAAWLASQYDCGHRL